MEGYKPQDSFGPDAAQQYISLKRGDEIQAVDFLSKIADRKNALELAIGTGRIAVPLSQKGIQVDGIDFSIAMIEQLRLQPGGEKLNVVEGNIVDIPIEGKYQLIYIVWNSFFNILTQEDQVKCFQSISKHLLSEGLFVIEAYVPDFLFKVNKEQYVNAEMILSDEVKIDILQHNSAVQIIEENHVKLSKKGIEFNPVVQRYAWPSELDLMANIAGMELKNRWGSWNKRPFDSKCEVHVSTYGLISNDL
jgi:SAM-dependent methyltransferase